MTDAPACTVRQGGEPGMRPHEYVILEIARERERQINVEGWTPEHDDKHQKSEMASAAAAYADHTACFRHADAYGSVYAIRAPNPLWPWDRRWWKPTNPRRDLIKAAALIVAEIERLDRADAIKAAPDKDAVVGGSDG